MPCLRQETLDNSSLLPLLPLLPLMVLSIVRFVLSRYLLHLLHIAIRLSLRRSHKIGGNTIDNTFLPPPTMGSTADYWVGPLLGEGSFGRVYRGKHKESSHEVAVKVVDKVVLLKQPALLHAVRQEQAILKDLRKCEHVVQLYASFHDCECVYLVMEMIVSDLERLIASQRVSATWYSYGVAHYAKQILSAMEAIHSRSIVHADLKPSNILVTADGVVKLADFGSAIIMQQHEQQQESSTGQPPQAVNQLTDRQQSKTACHQEELEKETTRSNKTMTLHAYRGTPQYSSPEIITGAYCKFDNDTLVAIDFWSFGCILYAMFQGESPFTSESMMETVDKVMGYAAGRVSLQPAENASSEWRSIISDLVQADPLERLRACGVAPVTSTEVKYSALKSRVHVTSDDDSNAILSLPYQNEGLDTETMQDGSEGWIVFSL
jgi:serine/threonine protein kinase